MVLCHPKMSFYASEKLTVMLTELGKWHTNEIIPSGSKILSLHCSTYLVVYELFDTTLSL